MLVKNLFYMSLAMLSCVATPFVSAESIQTSLNQISINNPVANESAIVKSGNTRFTILTPEMVRIEYSKDGVFEDRASFSIVNRNLDVPGFTTSEDDTFLYLTTSKLQLRYRKGTDPRIDSENNLLITFNLDGNVVEWFPGKADNLNLKGTCRTLDGSNGDNKRAEMEDGLISRSGWAVIDDSWTATRADGGHSFMLDAADDGVDWLAERKDKDALDIYFLGYGHDYKKALKDFTRVAGSIPLPPNYVFGYWYSKYQRYTQSDIEELANDLRRYNIPSDVMVIDTDWHINGWTGWNWNTELIPDPVGLLNKLHNDGLRVSLNLHPAFGIESNEAGFDNVLRDLNLSDTTQNIPWMMENKTFFKSVFKNVIRNREKEGVDFWWLDWQQWLTNPRCEGLSETFWCNYTFFNDMKVNRPERRAVIFHRWGGLGSHRYQIGFSGDSHSNFETLAFQPYFTATASNVGYTYWGHDLGGHIQPGDNDPELYLRWLQYGVFSPIFRTHSTNYENIERRIWKYPNFAQLLEAVKLRYSLFPYIYTMARATYDTGIGICRPLYYDYPNVEEAYAREDEYMFGSDILCAPITERSNSDGHIIKNVWLPKGNWWCVTSNRLLEGNKTYDLDYYLTEIPYFYKEGAIVVNYPDVKSVTEQPDRLIINFVAVPEGESAETSLYEDGGDNNDYQAGAYATTAIKQECKGKASIYTIAPRVGEFNGMIQQRAYTLKIYNTTAPVAANVNGRTAMFSYDTKAKCITIEIPTTPCDCAVEAVVTYTQSK